MLYVNGHQLEVSSKSQVPGVQVFLCQIHSHFVTSEYKPRSFSSEVEVTSMIHMC